MTWKEFVDWFETNVLGLPSDKEARRDYLTIRKEGMMMEYRGLTLRKRLEFLLDDLRYCCWRYKHTAFEWLWCHFPHPDVKKQLEEDKK